MLASALVIAAIELVSPAPDETVSLVPDNQKAVMTKVTLAEREALFAEDAKSGKKLKHGRWRKALPFRVAWRATAGEKGPWEIQIGKRPDLSDARKYLVSANNVDKYTGRATGTDTNDAVSVEVPLVNLEIATKYYWRVVGDLTCGVWGHKRHCKCRGDRGDSSSAVASFVTEDFAPRWIELEGRVDNFRDLGGRIGLDGRRVKQGLVYRSQGLNYNSVDGATAGRNRLTCEDVKLLVDDYGIRTDLDLRSEGEIAGMNGVSPLGKDVRFVWHSSSSYSGIFSESGRKVMASNFRVFLDEANYPILFHCIGGADRTGALAYVLNGVLGVRRQELETDWESTFYPTIPNKAKADSTREDEIKTGLAWNSEMHFERGFSKYGDANSTWNERIVLYLKDCGVTDDEIARFRELMLER